MFLGAIVAVVVIGLFPDLRPMYVRVAEDLADIGQVEMGRMIMIVMLAAAGVIMLAFNASPEKAVKGSIMKGGLVALISILGVSWMGSSFFEGNQNAIVGGVSGIIRQHPWEFALGMFVLSILLFSRAAAVVTLVPVGLAIGLPPHVVVGAFTAANGTFFLPTYGTVTLLAAVIIGQMDIKVPAVVKYVFFDLFLFTTGYKVGPQFFRGRSRRTHCPSSASRSSSASPACSPPTPRRS